MFPFQKPTAAPVQSPSLLKSVLFERLTAALDALEDAHRAFMGRGNYERDRVGAWSIERLDGVPIALLDAIDELRRQRAEIDTKMHAEMVYPETALTWRQLTEEQRQKAAEEMSPPARGGFEEAYGRRVL